MSWKSMTTAMGFPTWICTVAIAGINPAVYPPAITRRPIPPIGMIIRWLLVASWTRFIPDQGANKTKKQTPIQTTNNKKHSQTKQTTSFDSLRTMITTLHWAINQHWWTLVGGCWHDAQSRLPGTAAPCNGYALVIVGDSLQVGTRSSGTYPHPIILLGASGWQKIAKVWKPVRFT